jgi:hypothetical protein
MWQLVFVGSRGVNRYEHVRWDDPVRVAADGCGARIDRCSGGSLFHTKTGTHLPKSQWKA